MARSYKQPNVSSAVRFEKAPLAELEHSRMRVAPRTFTTYNAGDIVPVRCIEVLPHTNIKMSIDVINRLLSAMKVPTMGNMIMDVRAYFSSIREVNDSWKNVTGENTSGYWSAPEVELAPLYPLANQNNSSGMPSVKIPIGSVADYYGLPTQKAIPASVLSNMSDTIFKQYCHIYNEYYRDTNYQPPISFSKLNVYQGFLLPKGTTVSLDPYYNNTYVNSPALVPASANSVADGTTPQGAVVKALYGDGAIPSPTGFSIPGRVTNFSALDKPFKANKLHDEFTSVLPSPQRGPEIFFGVQDTAPIITKEEVNALGLPLVLTNSETPTERIAGNLASRNTVSPSNTSNGFIGVTDNESVGATYAQVTHSNLYADLSQATGISINDLRKSAAIQQIYEQLGRSGARYREFLKSFFGLDVENVFKDIPIELGHVRINLDMFQVAQTSSSDEESPQGNLSAYSYTDTGGYLFNFTALEHGFIHILVTVRQPNLYSSAVNPYWFRRSTLDWYYPQLANIGEQPMRLALLNPFRVDSMEKVIGFQEAWYEYRYESDITSGYCRTGLPETLGSWTYADNFDENFLVVNGDWLKSNAQEVLDRSLAETSAVAPQFIGCFTFNIEKEIPMPTYSVPGMDIL